MRMNRVVFLTTVFVWAALLYGTAAGGGISVSSLAGAFARHSTSL